MQWYLVAVFCIWRFEFTKYNLSIFTRSFFCFLCESANRRLAFSQQTKLLLYVSFSPMGWICRVLPLPTPKRKRTKLSPIIFFPFLRWRWPTRPHQIPIGNIITNMLILTMAISSLLTMDPVSEAPSTCSKKKKLLFFYFHVLFLLVMYQRMIANIVTFGKL